MEGLTVMLGAVLRRRRVHIHPTDGILHRRPGVVFGVMMVSMPVVTMMAVMQVGHVVPPFSDALGPWGLALRSLGRTLDPVESVGPTKRSLDLPTMGRSSDFIDTLGRSVRPSPAKGRGRDGRLFGETGSGALARGSGE
jgi:hypothetical protein